jgi:predicted DCC family thiol-disulfide oxidoreductase YuxK
LQELSITRPFNDQCGTAQRLQSGELITGASSGAWPHGLVNHVCSLQARSRGLFYSIEGTGDVITLSLRPDISEGKLEVAVLSQGDCGKCIASSDFITAEDNKHTIRFSSIKNEIYTIAVSGQGVSDAGVFQLGLTEDNELQKEDTENSFSAAGSTASSWSVTLLLVLMMVFAYET